ncbi:MAG: hypothetical protein HDQ99_14875 [Lachnospiraceae bacterium]|nr:hypothetical protein [Lachnospiraceae bacterium]
MKNKEYWKKWLAAAGIRAAKTGAQAVVAMVTVGQALMEVNWIHVLSVSATMVILSLATSIIGLPEVDVKEGEKGNGADLQ